MRCAWLFACCGLLLATHAAAQERAPAPAPTPAPPAPASQPPAPQAYPAYPGYPPPYPYPQYPQYPPAYGYQPPPEPPRTLHYEDGQPIPQGYYLEESVRRGPIIAGIIVLAVPYAIGFSVGSGVDFQDSSGWLLLPVAGPWVMMATRDDECAPDASYCDNDRVIRTLLVLDGLMQATGAALLVWGFTSPTKRLVRQDVGFSIGPRRVGSGYGFGAAGRF